MNQLTRNRDVLLQVLQDVDLDTLLSLRLTCRNIHDMIAAYESTIAVAVARNTFAEPEILPRLQESAREVGGKYSVKWLLDLVPSFLAMVAVDRYRWMNDGACGSMLWRQGVAAADPLGQPLRAKVANGFRILARLSRIAKDFENIPKSSLPRLSNVPMVERVKTVLRLRRKSGVSHDLEIVGRREKAVANKRLEYVKSIEPCQASDFQLMYSYVVAALYPVKLEGLRFNGRMPGGMLPGRNWTMTTSAWLLWLMMREGMSLLWDQWWARRKDPDAASLEENIQQIFSHKSNEQVLMECQSALVVYHEFHKADKINRQQTGEDWLHWQLKFCNEIYPAQRPERFSFE